MGLHSHQARQEQPNSPAVYVRHRPEATLLYQIVQEYWPEFQAELASHGRFLPAYVTKEFDEYLKCGRLEYGFLRVRCEFCHEEKLVAFSCKRRGFCPSCGARRMADSAALLVDEILPHQPMRQLSPGMACSRAEMPLTCCSQSGSRMALFAWPPGRRNWRENRVLKEQISIFRIQLMRDFAVN